MTGPTVLKLGGSVITHKDRPETVDETRLRETATAIGNATVEGLILVHGGGSFGHPAAERAGVSPEQGTTDDAAIREIHAAMGRLNDAVLDALQAAGVPAVPVRPFSMAHRDESGAVVHGIAHLEAMLEEGLVPVLHGDVITTAGAGATIVSGDELVVSIAGTLNAGAVGLCTAVPGVLDEHDAVIEEITRFADVASVLDGSEATDVTGGMAGKVWALLDLGVPARIFDPAGLESFLAGGEPGTRIRGDRR